MIRCIRVKENIVLLLDLLCMCITQQRTHEKAVEIGNTMSANAREIKRRKKFQNKRNCIKNVYSIIEAKK